jgi:hypothetical protein
VALGDADIPQLTQAVRAFANATNMCPAGLAPRVLAWMARRRLSTAAALLFSAACCMPSACPQRRASLPRVGHDAHLAVAYSWRVALLLRIPDARRRLSPRGGVGHMAAWMKTC